MRFIHVADIHASRERLSQTLSILNTLTERAKQGDIDFIIFAGDFWDSTITATKGSGFSDIITAIRELEEQTYLYFIYGTPSHEPSGSLDAFASEKTKVISENSFDIFIGDEKNADIYFIPEPRRSNYIGKSAEEINNAINSDISNCINSCQLKRKDYNRIVVYHGEVKGAVYQNGSSASSPTAISKDLLQSLNADYYALGHIHLPQEVFPNAWYSGSACPKNFGETHDGHYNLVSIENGKTEVEHISFGLPMYRTLYKRPEEMKDCNVNGYLRLIFDCTKEERKQMNLKAISDDIKTRTNAISVKIEPNVIEGEAVPVSEVVTHKSLVEKLTYYAKEKGLVIPKYAKEILQNIQDSTLAKLAYPQHSFELLYLSLRGAIGIHDGQGKEEFELDFSKFEDGVVCLIGHMGAGKSTVLENCHPYPKMLSRKGTLQDHFYLKDSHRILVYKDENGLYYRISMLIDGKTTNGKTSYYVETSKDREVWKSVVDVDGSSDSYKEWVNNTFGSIDIYLRTAFFAKEPTKDAPDISDTTKGERMELLSKLAGTDQLKEVSLIARESCKEVEKEADKIDTELSVYDRYDDLIKNNEQDIKSWNNELKAQNTSIALIEKEIAELKIADAEYKKQKAVAEMNKTLYKQYQKEQKEKESELTELTYVLNSFSNIEKISEYKSLVKENNKKIPQFQKDIAKNRKELESVENEIEEVKQRKDSLRKKISEIDTEIRLTQQQIVPVSKVCPTCGAELSISKYEELTAIIREKERKVEELKNQRNQWEVPEDKDDWTLVPLVSKRQKIKDDIFYLEEALSTMIGKTSEYNAFINEWDRYKNYSSFSKSELENKVNELKVKIEELITKQDDIVYDSCIEDVSNKLKETEAKLTRETNRKVEIIASIKSVEKENERLRKELKTVEDKRNQLKDLQDKITAYNFIENAFSNKGIPAIELRESAPEIADITNQILKNSYGNKFEIRFGSTSELKAKKKSDEDFNIIVTDTENCDEKTIDLVSSGERIWIKQALFYAFSIVQMNRTGFNFRTRLIDESDGSLDGETRPKYLKMVESAHKISNSRITIIITHSQEIKDIAQQIIEL